MRRLGVHVSIAGGIQHSIQRAVDLGCSTMQVFSHNPRGWAVKPRTGEESSVFRRLKRQYDISPVFVHSSYLINLAASDQVLRNKSIDLLVQEMHLADALGADYVILHPGSSSSAPPEEARQRVTDCLNRVSRAGRWRCGILLENTAGEKGDVACTIPEISAIFQSVPGPLVSGLCIDTCHAFAAGYDIRTASGLAVLSKEIETHIGREKIRLIHLNDSRKGLGSRVDRHEHVGGGEIGLEGFSNFLHHPGFTDLPLILETPKKDEDDDKRNLAVVRGLVSAQ
jgi:deoxyribonuclease-4